MPSRSRRGTTPTRLWHYPDPFAFYNPSADADDLAELLDPTLRGDEYVSVEDEAGEVVGFFQFKHGT